MSTRVPAPLRAFLAGPEVARSIGFIRLWWGKLIRTRWRLRRNRRATGRKLEIGPALTLFSVFLAFAFPFCVGVYSAVAARYKNRRVESIADFPEQKPDPVFRAKKTGELVEVGANTQKFFEKFGIDSAQRILGDEAWEKIITGERTDDRMIVYFEAEGEKYLVANAPTRNDEINVYMTRLSGLQVDR